MQSFTRACKLPATVLTLHRLVGRSHPAAPIRAPQLAVPSKRLNATGPNAAVQETTLERQQDELVFKPFDEVSEELQIVEQAELTSSKIEDSFARVNYSVEQEIAVNQQINIEYNMSYVYLSLGSYFARDNVGLPGFAAFFNASSLEERTHAQLLMNFQTKRGGRTKLAHLTGPPSEFQNEQKGDALHAMELALSFEKLNFQKLYELHDVADKHNDAEMASFVEEMLAEQADGVKLVSDYVAQLRRLGKGHGVWHFDRFLADVAKSM